MDIAQMTDAYIDKEFPSADTAVFRDLSLNFKKLLGDSQLEPAERFMMLLAISVALGNKPMADLARKGLKESGVADDHIRECAEVAGLMGMNNVYYKYRSFVSEEAKEFYTRAGLRMNSMMKPVTGKHLFEMLSLAISVINGCPTCVASHEKSIRDLGVTTEKIHDIARLAAVSKGLDSLKTAREFLA